MIVTSAVAACGGSPLCFLVGARGGSGSINRRAEMVTSILWALTIGMTFLLTPQVEASQGPGASKMDAKLGVEVEGPFEMICTFLGRSKKVIIIYRHGPKEWEPKLSCNDGARSEEHTSELQSLAYLVCRLLLEKKKTTDNCTCCA